MERLRAEISSGGTKGIKTPQNYLAAGEVRYPRDNLGASAKGVLALVNDDRQEDKLVRANKSGEHTVRARVKRR